MCCITNSSVRLKRRQKGDEEDGTAIEDSDDEKDNGSQRERDDEAVQYFQTFVVVFSFNIFIFSL